MTEQKKLEIAGRLRQLWEESDETYLSIAEAVGVRERTVAGWLSPSKPEAISYKSAKKVAKLFGVTIDWLWRGEDQVRVPADFMDRIAELEKQVSELSATRSAKDADEMEDRSAAEAQTSDEREDEQAPGAAAGSGS